MSNSFNSSNLLQNKQQLKCFKCCRNWALKKQVLVFTFSYSVVGLRCNLWILYFVPGIVFRRSRLLAQPSGRLSLFLPIGLTACLAAHSACRWTIFPMVPTYNQLKKAKLSIDVPWPNLTVSQSMRPIILEQKLILLQGCDNVAGKLRQKWWATAGTTFTKPRTSHKGAPSTPSTTRGAKTKVVSIPRHRPILIELSPVLKYHLSLRSTLISWHCNSPVCLLNPSV